MRHLSTKRKALPLLALAAALGGASVLALPAAPAFAQSKPAAAAAKAKTVRVRGDIESFDGSMLTVDSRDHKTVKVAVAPNVVVKAVEKAEISDIKEGDFVGVASVPDSGDDKAIEVLIFPAAMKGTGEGSYPWDKEPNSTMTNATVSNAVTGVDGRSITLKYPQGEKTVALPADIPVVTLADATPEDLKAGTRVFVPGSEAADGTVSAAFVVVGKDGVVPPM